jgi:hypothetical protein
MSHHADDELPGFSLFACGQANEVLLGIGRVFMGDLAKIYRSGARYISRRRQVKSRLSLLLAGCLLFDPTHLEAHTLCTKDERIAFSCSVGRKVVSLCHARAKLNDETWVMFYRFGVPGRVELTYPGRAVSAKKAFTSSLNLWSYDGSVVRFRVGKYMYSLYGTHVEGGGAIPVETELTTSGVTVRRDGRLAFRLTCKSVNAGTEELWFTAIQDAALETDARYLEEP